jgi:lycopene cyclase domain-containing protein
VTYFAVLGIFVIPPMLILLSLTLYDTWHRLTKQEGHVIWVPFLVLLAHVLLALVYTTPWDNYLVATNVWWYDPELVTGITLGWVPIEEYTFFIAQTLLTGLWMLVLMRFIFKGPRSLRPARSVRTGASVAVLIVWVASTLFLLTGPASGTYLTLILSWVLIPILLQVAFGADILLAHWRLVSAATLVPTLYLWMVDVIAIQGGTWTIDPAQTTGIKLGPLPIEEMVFFLMTNLLVVFGITLMLSEASKHRARAMIVELKWKHPDRALVLWAASLVFWVVLLVATPISIWLAGDTLFPMMVRLGAMAHTGATLIALASGWPAGRVVVALAVVSGGAWAVEALGSATGFPFGAYDYTEALQPQLAGVPLVIPLAWFMMLVPAWGIAGAILAGRRNQLGKWYAPLHAILAGAAFTAWDLYLDPQMVTRGLWVWDYPGGYFGIPWVNFLGWWLAASLITLLIRPRYLPRGRLMVIYTLTWIFQAIGLGLFWGQPGPALVGFLGMGIFVILAWRRELSNLPAYRSTSLPILQPSNR